MKPKILIVAALAALFIPVGLRAQDGNQAPAPVDRQRLREELRSLPPEEREAKLREMRERGGFAPGGAGQRQLPVGAGNRMGGDIERIMIVLTPEQRESMRGAMEENRDKMRELEEKLRAARKATLDAVLDKKFDEASVRAKLDAAAKLEAEFTLLRAKAFSKVEPPLSEEQIERIKNPPPIVQMGRQGQRPAGERPFRGQERPLPPGDGPGDVNHLPPPANP